MPSPSRYPSVRAAARHWRVFFIVSLLSLAVLFGQIPPPYVMASAPAGHSMGAWPALQAQIPGYLKAANVDAGDRFGWSVALDGDTMVVGAWAEEGNGSTPTDNSVDNAGAAYVFLRTTVDGGPIWMQQAYLKPAHPRQDDFFGYAVAIDGDTIVVGALLEDSNGSSPTDYSAPDAGAAYIFTRTDGSWTQQAYLKAGNVDAGDNFGAAVAIAGDTVIVSAPWEDSSTTGVNSTPNNAARDAGATYVFERTGTVWTQQAYLKAANAESGDLFGTSVAIAGDTLVVGAVYEDSDSSSPANNSARSAGAAYVFTRTDGIWTEQAYLKASNVEADDAFGYPVALDGATLIVGARGEDSNGSSPADNSALYAGAVYVFGHTNGAWTEQAYLKASNADADDDFGRGIAIAGDTVVVGASIESSDGSSPTDNSAHVAGAAYVFTRRADPQGVPVWSQQRYLKASNIDAGDGFGISVAIAGETVVVGASGEASAGSSPADNSAPYAGAVYVLSTRSFVYLPLLLRP